MSYEQKENKHNILWLEVEKLMKNQGYSQAELARKANINKTVVSSFKNGKIKKPSFKLMCKIADALEVSLDEFRQRNDEK